MLLHQHRNEEVYKKIAMQMTALGYERDWEQCRQRAKDLRRGYKDVKDQNRRSGRGRQVWQYFEELDTILGPLYELGSGYEGEDSVDDTSGDPFAKGSLAPQTTSCSDLQDSDPMESWVLGFGEGAELVQTPFQRAANWGEKETRDFLGIWGQERIQRMLHQQHWNEEVYKEVSVQMAALGYSRDWEQCRQRAKDLRRGYKDIKDQNRRSARGRKVWQYFEELDAILGQDLEMEPHGEQGQGDVSADDTIEDADPASSPVSQVPAQASSPVEPQDCDEIEVLIVGAGHSDGQASCQRAAKWGERETRDFLSIWGQEDVQSLLHHQHRNEEVYKQIAAQMAVMGYDRDWEQCRQRAKDLRRGYRDAKDQNRRSGRGRQVWQYFEELDAILGPWYEMGCSGHQDGDKAGEELCAGGSLVPLIPYHAQSMSPASTPELGEPLVLGCGEAMDNSQAPCQRAAKWGERETRDFLCLWGQDGVQSLLHQQYRNEEVYKQIAVQMTALGYERDWEQCRQRAKDLRRGYRDAKDQNRRYGRGKQVWQYFEELDAILGPWYEMGSSGHPEGDRSGEELGARKSPLPQAASVTSSLWQTTGPSEVMRSDNQALEGAQAGAPITELPAPSTSEGLPAPLVAKYPPHLCIRRCKRPRGGGSPQDPPLETKRPAAATNGFLKEESCLPARETEGKRESTVLRLTELGGGGGRESAC
uniref:Myb/SANT-like DNA-binding domain-containing protein n=1 Tax=Sphenodon punctatus TaxID=8508 RepID=A0A8D0LAJ6_SPHPU